MDSDNSTISVIEFDFLLTARAGNPAHTLKVKISRTSEASYRGVILEHLNNKGVLVHDLISPIVVGENPTQILIDMVSGYLTQYEASTKKPVFTLIK